VYLYNQKGGTMKNTVFRMIIAACLLMIVGTASAAVMTNPGIVGNYETLTIPSGYTLTIDENESLVCGMGATINVECGATVIVNGNMDIAYSTLNNNGTVINNKYLCIVPGTLNNCGVLENYGSIPSDGTIINNENAKFYNYGFISNCGWFYNSGTLYLYPSGIIVNDVIQGNPGIVAGSRNTEIPEFPAIALPFVAVLGIAFMFQRGKE